MRIIKQVHTEGRLNVSGEAARYPCAFVQSSCSLKGHQGATSFLTVPDSGSEGLCFPCQGDDDCSESGQPLESRRKLCSTAFIFF